MSSQPAPCKWISGRSTARTSTWRPSSGRRWPGGMTTEGDGQAEGEGQGEGKEIYPRVAGKSY